MSLGSLTLHAPEAGNFVGLIPNYRSKQCHNKNPTKKKNPYLNHTERSTLRSQNLGAWSVPTEPKQIFTPRYSKVNHTIILMTAQPLL
jgi:hypothetical protein